MTKRILLFFLSFIFFFSLLGQQITEIDYDQPGADNAEFIEFSFPPGADLSDYRVTLYAGSNGKLYDEFTLDDTNVTCTSGLGIQFCIWDPPGNNNINSATAGISLYQISTMTLIEFISYGGSFTASEGDADGQTSTDIGSTESNSTSAGMSLQRNEGLDTWFGPSSSSPGAANVSPNLPIVLVSFDAKIMEERSAVKLNWVTASEINNDYFSIQHSRNGIDFRELAKQDGAGTSNEIQEYNYAHEKVGMGLHYYRIQQVDYDGTNEFSFIVSVEIKESSQEVSITPNPSSSFVSVVSKRLFTAQSSYQLLNMRGQIVQENRLVENTSVFELEIFDLPQGIYFLKIIIGNEAITKKITKVKE